MTKIKALLIFFFLLFSSAVSAENLYDILSDAELGISLSSASPQKEVNEAYERLKEKYQDGSEEAKKRMEDINIAWNILGDPEKRVQYDDYLLREAPNLSSSPGSKQKANWQPRVSFSRAAEDSLFHLLRSPDPLAVQFRALKEPLDFLESKGLPSKHLMAELTETITQEFHQIFRAPLAVQERVQWDWEKINLRAIETFLKRYETLLGRENIDRFLKDIEAPSSRVSEQEVQYLRNFLREVGIPISNEATLRRILNHFKSDYKKSDFLVYADWRRHSESPPSPEDWNDSILRELNEAVRKSSGNPDIPSKLDIYLIIYEFAPFVEIEYPVKLSRGKRKSVNSLHKILSAEGGIGEREVRLFRGILERHHIPTESYNNDMLRSYLWFMKPLQAESKKRTITDREALDHLSAIAIQFEEQYYHLLKDQKKFKNFVIGFLIQYPLFHTAMGLSTLFEHYVIDPLKYDTHTNPIPFKTATETPLTLSAFVNLGAFTYISQLTHFWTYHLGKKWNSTPIKWASGSIALMAGYMVSQALTEAMEDEDLKECFKSYMEDSENLKAQYISSCEAARVNWSEKLNYYMPDGLNLIFSGLVSHGAVKYSALGLRYFKPTDRLLTGLASKLGRFANPISWVFSIFLFNKFFEGFDHYVAKKWKEESYVREIKHSVNLFSEKLEEFSVLRDALNSSQTELTEAEKELERIEGTELSEADSAREEEYQKLLIKNERLRENTEEFIEEEFIDPTKDIDHFFEKWPEVKGAWYNQSILLWVTETNKTLGSYEKSKELLQELYALSNRSELGPSNEYFDEIRRTRDQKLEAKTIEYTTQTNLNNIIEICNKNENIDEDIDSLHINYLTGKSPEVYKAHVGLICQESHHILSQSIYSPFFFSLNDLQDQQEKFMTALRRNVCREYQKIEAEIGPVLSLWHGLCNGANVDLNASSIDSFGWQTLMLVAFILQSELFDDLDNMVIGEASAYVGWDLNELLSPYRYKNLSLRKDLYKEEGEEQKNEGYKDTDLLSPTEKLALARKLLNPYDPVLPEESVKKEWIGRYCEAKFLNKFNEEETTSCLQSQEASAAVERLLGEKAFAAGFYLLKEALVNVSLFYQSAAVVNPATYLQTITDFIYVFKKGERYYGPKGNSGDDLENQLSTQLLYNLLCGTEKGEISGDSFLISPQIFTEMQPLCEVLSEGGLSHFRENLFKKPTFFRGELYETPYLALEEVIREKFGSNESALSFFERAVSPLVEELRESSFRDFSNLVNNYLMPNLINEEARGITSCEDIRSHYTTWRTSDFKGLEIPLYQVNYWISQLETLKKLDEGYNGNQRNQNKIHCQTLQLLKGYHDGYLKSEDPLNPRTENFFVFPDSNFLEKAMAEEMKEAERARKNPVPLLRKSLVEKIQESFSGNQIFISKELLFYAIIEEFFPEFNSPLFLWNHAAGKHCFETEKNLIKSIQGSSDEEPDFPPLLAPIEENCQPFSEGRDRLIYATLVSLYKSLGRYYEYLNFLIQKQRLQAISNTL